MVIEVGGVKALLGGAWNVPAKPCDSCKSGTASLFCRADSAFLCLACNAKIHCANKLSTRHERVWMCEVCEQAPAAVTCKADAAALCVTCDADIHSANPLAQRHERVPVEPFFDSDVDSIVNLHVVPNCSHEIEIPNPNANNSKLVDTFDMNSGAILFPEMDDPFLDFDYPKSIDSRFHHSAGTDSVVPVQTKPLAAPVINHRSSEINCFDMDFCRSKLSSFSYPSQSISQSVSSSSVDVGVVPDGNCNSVSDTSYPFGRYISFEASGVVDIVPSATTTTAPAQPTQLSGIDREARVLRYREKRKNRKFEKTIRYASRKAYAETRPRIKGRFAKRAETGADADGLYGNSAVSEAYMGMGDYQYGVVPSF